MGRPAKTLAELVLDGTFRARRPTHSALLVGPDLPWEGFALLQARYRAATSEEERRQVAREFERAVQVVHQQALAEGTPAERLRAELAQLGEPGSIEALFAFFSEWLVHPKGPMLGQPFVLEPWQQAFLREFYRSDGQGRRIYRLGVLGIPRGNGKTCLAAGLGLYELLTRTDAPEVYFAAASKEQARIALSFARAFAAEGPLAQWIKGTHTLSCPASAGVLQVLSSEGSLQHGRAPAVAILDELWALETRRQVESYEALTSGLHKRQDAFLLAITTAGWNNDSLLAHIYQHALDWPEVETSPDGCLTVAKDQDNGLLLCWYGAAADADPDDPELWRACNPASFVDLRDLKRQKADPGLGELGFRRLHLNQWTHARDAWLPHRCWDTLKDDTLTIPDRAEVFVGVDVSRSHDTTAVAWAYRQPDGRIIVRTRVWAANDKPAHQHLDGIIELEAIEAFILKLAATFKVREVCYDPRFFERSAELLTKKGLTMVEFLQASPPMVDATQRFYQLATEGRLAHNGDPILAAHIHATAAKPAERGWKISKIKQSQAIDATVAAIMAAARADIHKPRRASVYWMEA